MYYQKTILTVAVVVIISMLLAGCYKNKIVNLVGEAEVTKEVSFSGDIIPIFNSSCNMGGCHNAGGIKPNLSPSGAYMALTGGGYVNVNDPKNSELYLWMTGKKGTPMPLSGPNSEYNALILAWIRQGSRNN